MNQGSKKLSPLDMKLYKCISPKIITDTVILTDKQIIHMEEHHPESFHDVLISLNETIKSPDYILKDEKHDCTGLVIKEIPSSSKSKEHSFIVLRICTDFNHPFFANSIISGWKISDKRLQNYLRNKPILYKNT